MERFKPKIVCNDGVTKQNFKDDCDINAIMKRYEKTGRLPQLMKENPIYGDFSTVVDYQKAHEIIERAEMQFMELSASVRDRFQNDPAKFLEFVGNPENEKEMVEMGLAKAKQVEPAESGEIEASETEPKN